MTEAARYLLDTNILSDLVRSPHGVVALNIARVGEASVFTSIIVASELRFGAAKRNSMRLTEQVERILAAIEVLAFDAPADQHYAALRLALELKGTPIGPNDLLIAAHALAHSATVVTANTDEFSRVPGLVVENWLNRYVPVRPMQAARGMLSGMNTDFDREDDRS